MEKSNGKILISLVAIVILFVAILFTSFAIFAYTKKGIEENKITTGTVSMSFNETPNGKINITNAHPITDEEGKKLLKQDTTKEQTVTSGYFDFTVSANVTGDANIGYDVYLQNASEGTVLPDKYVKVYLTNGDTEVAYPDYQATVPTYASLSTVQEDTSKRIIYHGTFTKGDVTQNFRLRLWVASTYGEVEEDAKTSKTFKAKVGVEAQQEL